MIFKRSEIEKHFFVNLGFTSRAANLRWIVTMADAYAVQRFGKPLLVTNVLEDGPASDSHAELRAVDARVIYRSRGEEVEYFTREQADEIARWVNDRFTIPEKFADGRPMLVCIVHGSPLHFHFQIGRSGILKVNLNMRPFHEALAAASGPKDHKAVTPKPKKEKKGMASKLIGAVLGGLGKGLNLASLVTSLIPTAIRFLLEQAFPTLDDLPEAERHPFLTEKLRAWGDKQVTIGDTDGDGEPDTSVGMVVEEVSDALFAGVAPVIATVILRFASYEE